MSKGSLGAQTKDPDEVLDFAVDWTNLLATAETVSSVTWTVPTGLTKTAQGLATPIATVWLSGGTVGTVYTIECKVVTSGGRTFDRSFDIKVEHK